MIDFVKIPLKIAPIQTILLIIDKIIYALIPSLQILVTASFIDTAIDIFKNGGNGRIYLPLFLLMAIIAYQYIGFALMNFVRLKLSMKLNEQFRVAVVEKRAKLEYRHVENNETWELINRVCGNPDNRIYDRLYL